MEGKGLFIAEGKPPVECKLYLAGDQLNIYLENAEQDMFIWNIQNLRSRHWREDTLVMEYGSASVQQLECTGTFARDIDHKAHIFFNVAPISYHKPTRKIWVPLFAVLFLVLTFGFAVWFYIVPWIGERAASLVPVEAEISLGKTLSEMYAEGSSDSDSASIYMQQFVNKLRLDQTYPIRVRVIRSEEINAFALPGGNIFVYSGILKKMKSHGELVALLGHEITHVQHRHSLKTMCRAAAGSLLLSALFGDASGVSSVIISQADRFKELDYSRDLELEADNNGLQIMAENKVNQQGMLDLLELLKREGTATPGLMKYLSTHPETQARIDNVRGQISGVKKAAEQTQLDQVFLKLQKTLN